MDLKGLVQRTDTTAGRLFDLMIQALIITSLVSFSVDTLPNLSAPAQQLLRTVEAVTVAIFTVEYFLRIAVADRRLGYVFSFFGLIDLLAILPFYITSGVDLRAVRAFRLLRLLRALKLVRFSEAIQRFHRAFRIAREEIVLFLGVACVLMFLAAVGIYYFENPTQPEAFRSVFHSLWWAVVTLSSVGYGDVYPVTAGGRIFTFFVLMVGLGVVAVPAGIVASALGEARRPEQAEPAEDTPKARQARATEAQTR